MVSRSASCSILGGNSTNSRSKLTENFMSEDRRLACLGRHASSFSNEQAGSLFAESGWKPDFLCECRRASVSSCELSQETQIVLHEETNVWYVEQNHRESIHSQAEGEASPLFRIVGAVLPRFVYGLEHSGMDHPASTNFNPLFAAFHRFRFYVDLEARFRERKIMRAKTHGRINPEKLAQEKLKPPL